MSHTTIFRAVNPLVKTARLVVGIAVVTLCALSARAQDAAVSFFGPEGSTNILNLTEEPQPSDGASSQESEQPAGKTASEEELAKLAQNPVANLISLPFQSNFNFGVGSREVTQYVLNFQPVIPMTLNDDWNLITRTIIPTINQPSPADGVPSAFGLGDINPTLFLSPAKPGKFIWGFGPTFTIPTGTDPSLTSGKFSIGPAFVVLRIDGHMVYGALMNQQWSVAGWGGGYVSQMVCQPFFNYNLPGGWYLTTSPLITANWAANSRDVWTVPLGGGFGKIIKVGGKLPVNLQLQAFANAARPSGGPDWSIRFQIQILLPK